MGKKVKRIKIGVAALVPVTGRPNFFWCLDCAKGRGITLPGGKWEEGEKFSATAERELFEETGIDGVAKQLIFAGMNVDGWFCYVFEVEPLSLSARVDESAEGKIVKSSWRSLLTSKFGPFYEVVKHYWDHLHPNIPPLGET